MSKLIEFKNVKGELLRGIFDEAPSDTAIIFLSGFERTTIESKFKNIVDQFRGKLNLFRFDFSGLGMSDGDFSDISVKKMVGEIGSAIQAVAEDNKNIRKFILIAHSLGCCAAIKYWSAYPDKITKAVFLAPALNQKMLHRFWFATSRAKAKGEEATWDDFQQLVDEKEFTDLCNQPNRMTKEHNLTNKYFVENMNLDYQDLLAKIDRSKLLVIQSEMDDKVPMQSNDKIKQFSIKFMRLLEGDHDIQAPNVVKQYLPEIINFIETK